MRRQRTFSAEAYVAPQAGATAQRSFGRFKAASESSSKAFARAPYTTFFFILLVTFLVAFPKGGVKVGNVPVTIGYVALGFVTFLGLGRFLTNLHNLPQNASVAWLFTVPFQLTLVITYLTLGVAKDSSTLLIVAATSFIFMPTAFLLILAPSLRLLQSDTIKATLVFAIRFICIFGLIVFSVKTLTGYTVEIPFLTVNLDDIDALGSKNNTRGELFKLISTYNNGNIFGVCLGMMLPLYYFIERKRIFFILAIVCMLLTLSRTAWVAAVLILMTIAFIEGLKPARIAGLGLLALVFIGVLPILVELMGRDVGKFLFDSGLGNRSSQLEAFFDFHFEPIAPISNIYEMIYASIYGNYGLFGLISFLSFLGGPIAVILFRRNRTPVNRAAAAGMFIYMIVSMSDGAIMLIPVMAHYFFVALLGLEIVEDDQDISDASSSNPSPIRRHGFRRARFQLNE
ncbi:O-antigen ligase family protein [Xanthobacter pseudotagetidis]|uniref:O-antigen ligase family protein n=1 Tax=Xanthobacter pseudotagetidis TaxID=3119911 RepID=UPI003728CB5B